jgi:hypothetical protein
MLAAAGNNLVPILIFGFIGWRVVSRIRRNIGRQRVSTPRLLMRVGIYTVLTLFLAAGLAVAGADLQVFAGMAGGLVLGAGLGFYGLHLTRFETTPEGRFYTPNPYVGAGVSFLFVARLAYRFLVLSSPAAAANSPQLLHSALTLLLYGVLAGYYMAYFLGVFARTRAK